MNAIVKFTATLTLAGITLFASMSASAWWNDDDYYDRWHGGRWYGYPGYAWGGCPGYGWGGYPCYGWGGYPGYRQSRTIIVIPQVRDGASKPVAEAPR
jgi:hypothetical protein